jgi:endonuclease/exonuclease/phosphatase (EEP) superfamily protein YafD
MTPAVRRRLLFTAVAAAGVLLPDQVALDHRSPFLELVAWRPQIGLVVAVGAAGLAVHRRLRPVGAVLVSTALLGTTGAVRRSVPRAHPAPGPDDLTILNLNVLRGGADVDALARLVTCEVPDLVVLTESGQAFRARLMPLVERLGYRSWVSSDEGVRESRGITLLAAPRAGDLQVRPGHAMQCRHLHVAGGALGEHELFAVRVTAPRSRRQRAAWRADLAVLGGWCHGRMPPIVVGDLNATLDHSALRRALGGCRSAAAGAGHGLVGTYPAALPRWSGIQIDHVLVPAGTTTTRFAVHDVAGTDHRAVLVRLRLTTRSADLARTASGASGQSSAPHPQAGNATKADRSGSTRCLWNRLRTALATRDIPPL